MAGSKLSRRSFIGRSAVVVGGLIAAPAVLEACSPASTTPAPASAAPATAAPGASQAAAEVSDFGVPLPADAAPKANQYTVTAANSTGLGWKAMDLLESIYSAGPLYTNMGESLVRLDKDWQVLPAQAEKWEVAADGVTWTFTLKQGLLWTNGDEVTADDYVAAFRYAADPKHAWDFTWYYDGTIKNFGKAARGEVPTSEVGIAVGADKYQVVFTTELPAPYLPGMLVYSAPLHAKSLAKYGSAIYNTDPKTAVTSGPYMLEEWSPEKRISLTANLNYTGTLKPMTDKLVANVVTGGSDFARYQAGEIDAVASLSAEDVKIVLADPDLKSQFYQNPGDFRTYYMFFDVTKAPFNDKRVRLAFAKSIDREAIVAGILAPTAVPALSWLMPGFPDADEEALKSIQAYDPAAAKQLLADAGFPDGKGFPAQTLIVRAGTPSDPAVTQAVAASISQVLGVQIDLQSLDQPVFMTELLKKPTNIPLGWISYGMDYLDATNMLGVFKGGGRHNWNNAAYDKLIVEGGAITNDPAARSKAMKDAERLLVEDCPAAFVYHPLASQLHKPYRKGSWKDANKTGYTGAQWPGESALTDIYNTMYQGKEVLTMRKS